MKVILASSSSTRCQLMNRLGLQFISVAHNIDETPHPKESAQKLSQRLAKQKVLAIAKKHPSAVVIGSDQCCDIEGIILGKPQNTANAMQQLMLASGKSVVFFTALAIYHPNLKDLITHLDITSVTFRQLTLLEIMNYLEKEEVLSCAGSFKCEGLGITLFSKIKQNDPTALLGLPLIALNQYLIELGINPLRIKK